MQINEDLYYKDLETSYKSIPNIERLFGKKILIAGATGLIGGFLVDLIMYMNKVHNATVIVYALGRDAERLSKRFEMWKDSLQLRFVVQDITYQIECNDSVDYIVNAAGDGFPSAFRENPVETMTAAFMGTHNLLEWTKGKNLSKFLFISSGEIYGELAGCFHPFKENEVGSYNTMNVRSCYPISKMATETLCASYHKEYGENIVIARLSHTYGTMVSTSDNRATSQFLADAVNNRNIVMYSDGRKMRSYTYVADACSGIMTILIDGEPGEVYNVANDNSRVTIAEFANELAKVAGVKVDMVLPGKKQIEENTSIDYAVLSSDKLIGLGWTCKYDIWTGIERMYELVIKH